MLHFQFRQISVFGHFHVSSPKSYLLPEYQYSLIHVYGENVVRSSLYPSNPNGPDPSGKTRTTRLRTPTTQLHPKNTNTHRAGGNSLHTRQNFMERKTFPSVPRTTYQIFSTIGRVSCEYQFFFLFFHLILEKIARARTFTLDIFEI